MPLDGVSSKCNASFIFTDTTKLVIPLHLTLFRIYKNYFLECIYVFFHTFFDDANRLISMRLKEVYAEH